MVKKFVDLSVCALLLGAVACSKTNETTGITEDGNPIAEGSSSSSFVAESSSSSDGSARYKFDLWNGSNGAARVNVGNNAGYWYSVDDEEEGGSSSIKFPVSLDNESDKMDSLVSYCGGMCGTVELGEGSSTPSAGVGIALAEKDSTIDISDWDGLCISYESELSMKGILGYKDGDVDATAENMPSVNFEKTAKGAASSRCAQWTDFKQNSANVNSGSSIFKKATSLIFKFYGNPKESGYFNIKGVSSYKHGIVESETCLWNGTSKDPSDFVKATANGIGGGFWYAYNDNDLGGASVLDWETGSPDEYMSSSEWVSDVVSAKGGFSATAILDKGSANQAFAGVGIKIVGYDEETSDYYPMASNIEDWGGVCVTYMSEMDMHVILVSDSVNEKGAVLNKAITPTEKCLTWKDMATGGLEKTARVIKFEMTADSSAQARFNIIAIGKYLPDGACVIDESRVAQF